MSTSRHSIRNHWFNIKEGSRRPPSAASSFKPPVPIRKGKEVLQARPLIRHPSVDTPKLRIGLEDPPVRPQLGQAAESTSPVNFTSYQNPEPLGSDIIETQGPAEPADPLPSDSSTDIYIPASADPMAEELAHQTAELSLQDPFASQSKVTPEMAAHFYKSLFN
ncbi:hypothetical protein M404DRAFT_29754 [Pisolithus tinctorius Marx 270]|uniref:Uncharacterized protein n=1 Tax=Pisolithus tinctorius Marx 270 TaxID=870435 RepID=A0A0C3ITA3_PISTI|nr:hypothetical protein M404DRAFT_29754 [Pisolithus tinctorius Marx 270]